MTTTLRVIVDDVVAPPTAGIGRYAEEVTRALIETAPSGCEVSGVIASSPESDYDAIRTLLPGLADLFKSALGRRELQLAWQHGIPKLPGSGMVHAPSLLAPLSRHNRVQNPGNQTVVSIHDAVAWTHPELLNPRQVSWTRAMGRRAERYADAVIVPTHAVADELNEALDLTDRICVVGGAVSPKLRVPVDADDRARALGLPPRYIFTAGTIEPRKAIASLIASLATDDDAGLPLIVAGRSGWGDIDVNALAMESGLDEARVRHLGLLSDADLSVALDRATVFVYPSLVEGFGTPILEAFHFGTPVVHSDAPALVELAAGAGVSVATDDEDMYPDRIARVISEVINDARALERLEFMGRDRAAAFSWHDTAQRIWQVHADL